MARVYLNKFEAYILIGMLECDAEETEDVGGDASILRELAERIDRCVKMQDERKTATIKIAADQITE